MFFMTFVAYFCAKQIEYENNTILFKWIGILIPLIVLGIFKYFNFFTESFYKLFGISGYSSLNIILPVGISFYTFQSMSYTIDVIRKQIKAQSFINVALYIAFFPQLVAGPIVKASDFIPQLYENRKIDANNFLTGIQIFVMGLLKKVVIADNLSVFVDDVFARPAIFSTTSIILAVISYSIQIYCDFSGYSDMAIGTAKCLGYDFNTNFNMPYISKNVSEFWKRWHISLSTWLQEYLYIPLGGNRKGKTRTYINLLLTMVIGGLWHGANVTFIVWGFLHGIALCFHKLFKATFARNKKHSLIGSLISVLITYVFVCVCWVFFRAENLSSALLMLNRIFIWHDGVVQIFSWSIVAIILVSAATLVACLKSKKASLSKIDGFYPVMNLSKISSLTLFFTVIGLILATAFTDSNPFIYFQF